MNPMAPRQPSAKGFVIGGMLMALAVALFVGGLVSWFMQASDTLDGYQRVPIDGGGTVELGEGTYRVFLERPGADEGIAFVTFEVAGPDGAPVPVRPERFDETYSFDGTDGRSVGRIEVRDPGPHEVVTPPGAGLAGGELAFGRKGPLSSSIPLLVGSVFGGGGLFVVGLIIVIVTGVRRGRARRAAHPGPYGGGAPAWGTTPGGWVPPPGGSSIPPAPPVGDGPDARPGWAPPPQAPSPPPPSSPLPPPPPPTSAPPSADPPGWREPPPFQAPPPWRPGPDVGPPAAEPPTDDPHRGAIS
jgi:hypothetical protein